MALGRNDSVLGFVDRAHVALWSPKGLGELAVELGRTARLLMEHSRTIWGLKQLLKELSGFYPQLESQLPSYHVHAFYGRRLENGEKKDLLALVRHFDVLEELLASLDDSKWLRMAELGVACGPIGLFLLQRFPKLQYFGADPTIRDEVREAYRHLGGIESQRMTI